MNCSVSNSGNGNGKLTSSAFDITVFGVVVAILCILILVAALVLCRMKHVEQVNALRFDGELQSNFCCCSLKSFILTMACGLSQWPVASHSGLWPIREEERQARGSDKEKSKFSCLLK